MKTNFNILTGQFYITDEMGLVIESGFATRKEAREYINMLKRV